MPAQQHLVYSCTSPGGFVATKTGAGSWCDGGAAVPLSRLWLGVLRSVGVMVDDFGDAGGQVLDGVGL
jgi:hypothetical protein